MTKENNTPAQSKIGNVINTLGIKPAKSKIHKWARWSLLILLIFFICWYIYSESEEDFTLDEVKQKIKPNTMLHNMVFEMDDEMQTAYLKLLQQSFNDEPTLLKKCMEALRVALITGLVSEYIVSGNLHKPIGIVAKTVVSTILLTIVTN